MIGAWAETLLALALLAPLLAALLLAGRGLFAVPVAEGRPVEDGDAAERGSVRLASFAAASSLLALVALDVGAWQHDLPSHLHLGAWFAVPDFEFPVSFFLDHRSLPLATLVALLGLIVIRFSAGYMHREPGVHRFFAGLTLFIAGMLTLVLAGNAGLSFIGWELAGLSSWLLIGFSLQRATATHFALRAFVTNRIGDAGFMVGIAAALYGLGSLQWPVIGTASHSLGEMTGSMLVFGFVLAAAVKSAQVPFSPWITRALEGPTPSSAIFYGALLVHAGVYLLIRMEPVLQATPFLRGLIVVLGTLTVIYAVLTGWVQTDVKSALLLSTLTQVGLMFVACGLGWFDLAYGHLLLHAAWRAHQFLLAPSYLRLLPDPTRPLPRALRRWPRLYLTALSRFWLEPQGDALLMRPTRGLGRDVNAFDQQVLSRLMGGNERGQDGHDAAALMRGYGVAGRLLAALANRCAALESHLVLRGKDGLLARTLARLGDYLAAIEVLLERPRYLLVLIMATFAVLLS